MGHRILLLIAATITASVECAHYLSKPTLDLGDKSLAFVEVNPAATAYNQLIVKKFRDNVVFSIKWHAKMACELNTQASLTEKVNNVSVNKPGRYQIIVTICNALGCRSSDPTEFVVADTDGSHLSLTDFKMQGKNKPFRQTSGKVVAAYYIESAINLNDGKYDVSNIPVPNLTHLLYGYIPICVPNTNDEYLKKSCKDRKDFQVTIHDIYAAVLRPDRNTSVSKEYYKGFFGGLMKAKQVNPDLNVLASIGGWEQSDGFFFLDDKFKRDRFIASVKDFLENWKFFDGIDIAWKFPGGEGKNPNLGGPQDGKTYISLLKELREMLNNLATEANKKYELTSVISAGCDRIKTVNYTEAQKYLDYLFIMNRNFEGSWPNYNLAHESPLYAPAWNPNERYTTDFGVKCLLSQGVDRKKIVVGVIMHGRQWTNVRGYKDNNPFTGTASGPVNGSWEFDSSEYRNIANKISQGIWEYHYDDIAKAPYIFNEKARILMSYDDKKSVSEKAKYVNANNLGGMVAYSIDGDDGDILNAMNEELGNRW